MFLHNIYKKILLHTILLTRFVLVVCTDCILKRLRMFIYNICKIRLLRELTQTGKKVLELLLSKRIVKLCIDF